MAHPHYKNLVKAKVIATIEMAKAHGETNHQGLKGFFRELIVKELLRPFLPNDVGIGKGQIIDHKGGTSSECDLIIYHKNIISPWLEENLSGIIPFESALCNIEIKSRITSKELKTSITKAKSVYDLRYIDKKYLPKESGLFPTSNSIFAFDSDLTYKNETDLERYLRNDLKGNVCPVIQAICVVGRGYWIFSRDEKYKFYEPTNEYNEVIAFISHMINTIAYRCNYLPKLPIGFYFLEDRTGKIIS